MSVRAEGLEELTIPMFIVAGSILLSTHVFGGGAYFVYVHERL